jgi:predicted MFS family arabinose efflux permease
VRAQLALCLQQAAAIAFVALSSGNFPLTLVGLFVWGLAFGGVPVVSQIWMFNSAPKLYESGAAIMVSFLQVGLASGALFGGKIVDMVGVSRTFYLAAVVSALSLLVFGLVKREPEKTNV